MPGLEVDGRKLVSPSASADAAPNRNRVPFIGFVSESASAAILSEAFQPALPRGSPFYIVPFRTTLAVLSRIATPEIVLVDLSSEDQLLNAMTDLAEVVERGSVVLMIGQSRNLSFYRTAVTRMGVKEYLSKPLTKAAITRHFLPLLGPIAQARTEMGRSGRLIAVTGVRGGVGTSTIATNLAWSLGHDTHCHAVLLDADLQRGTTGLSLGIPANSGLLTALESPERVDKMLIERVCQPAGDRLHLLSAQAPVDKEISYAPASAVILTSALRQRFNFIIVDAGARHLPFARHLLNLAHQHIIVLDQTVLAVHNFERLNDLAADSYQNPKAILVLNQAGRPFGLSQASMETKLGLKFDVVIPDLPRLIARSEQYGEIAASVRGGFRTAIMQLAKLLGAETYPVQSSKLESPPDPCTETRRATHRAQHAQHRFRPKPRPQTAAS